MKKRNRNIRSQLSILFISFSIFIIGILGIITLALTNNHFNKYVKERQDELLNQYVNTIELLWINDKDWDMNEIEKVSTNAIENNMYFSIENTKKDTIFNLQGNQLKKVQNQLKNSTEKSTDKTNLTLNDLVSVTKPIKNNQQVVGYITFYYFGPFGYTKHDVMFLTSMKNSLILIFVSALFVSFILSSWISSRLSSPLKSITSFTKKLAQRDYSSDFSINTSVTEINSLTESLNMLRDELEKQESLRKRLTTDIAHELRTPLTSLKGNMEGIRDGILDLSPERIDSCYEEIERVTRLIGNIELLNQIELNYNHLEKSRFDLFKLTELIINNFSSQINQQNIKVSILGSKISVYADRDKISQVITNLLSNSLKFTKDNGSINFFIEHDSKQVTFKIQDDGIGIDPAHQKYIFDRLYMVESSRNHPLGGQGIGLSIVKEVVKAHNGTIHLKSEIGKGTTITLTLPINI